jgi:hypothetical protein
LLVRPLVDAKQHEPCDSPSKSNIGLYSYYLKGIIMDTYEEYKFKKRIEQLEMEISQLMENNTNLNLKIQALSDALISHYGATV